MIPPKLFLTVEGGMYIMMTLEQYIANPMGKANAVVASAYRETIKTDYTVRFHNLMVRENGKLKYYVYRNDQDNLWFIHVKVPSEHVKGFFYDVVFKFSADPTVADGGRDLRNWYVQFFSNDPAWNYTYAYAYTQQDLIIKELSSKMDKTCMNTPAKEKNPTNMVNYSKIIYFGYLFLKERGLLKTAALGGYEQYTLRTMHSRIENATMWIAKRQEEEKHISHKKKILLDDKTLKKLKSYGKLSDQAEERLVTQTQKTTKVKNIKAVNYVKNVKKKR